MLILFVLTAFVAWQCFTLPSVEMGGWWVDQETADAELTAHSYNPVQHPPGPIEIAIRGIACTVGVLLGIKLIRALGGSKTATHK
jgi:hypothetical protein